MNGLFVSGPQASSREAASWCPEGVQGHCLAPLLKTVKQAIMPHGGRVRLFFMDEARFGQQGTTTRVWAKKGSRPTVVKQTR